MRESVCVSEERVCIPLHTHKRKRTHSIGREHILQEENTFYRDRQIASHSTLTKEKSGYSYQINTYEGGSAQEADQDFTTYFQIGDWHDTLFLGFSQENAPFFASDVRFWVDRYTGKAVMHCHDLEDEDHGMMNGFYLSGQEGTPVDSRTRRIDPTCYSKSNEVDFQLPFERGGGSVPRACWLMLLTCPQAYSYIRAT